MYKILLMMSLFVYISVVFAASVALTVWTVAEIQTIIVPIAMRTLVALKDRQLNRNLTFLLKPDTASNYVFV